MILPPYKPNAIVEVLRPARDNYGPAAAVTKVVVPLRLTTLADQEVLGVVRLKSQDVCRFTVERGMSIRLDEVEAGKVSSIDSVASTVPGGEPDRLTIHWGRKVKPTDVEVIVESAQQPAPPISVKPASRLKLLASSK